MKRKQLWFLTLVIIAAVAFCWGVTQTMAARRQLPPGHMADAIKQKLKSNPDWLKNFKPGAELGVQATAPGPGAAPQSSGPLVGAAPSGPRVGVGFTYPPSMNIPTPAIGFNQYVNYGASLYAISPPIQKFVDTLPGLGKANASNVGSYIPVAIPNKTTYTTALGNSPDDYYELSENEYTQVLHTGMPPTILRGYAQTNTTDTTVAGVNQYLGPAIIARSYDPTLASGAAFPNPVTINGVAYGPYTNGAPVRLKVTNNLPLLTVQPPPQDPAPLGGNPTFKSDWFLPTDRTLMGAGAVPGATSMSMTETYANNRTSVHLHGGFTPWISDGTPFQWFTPAGQTASITKGASFQNAPDMVTGAACKGGTACVPGTATDGMQGLYYTNQQSSRLMFYHDHAHGITRLNVYAGMAAPYLLVDQYEEALIDSGVVPNQAGIDKTPGAPLTGAGAGGIYRYGIPLVIQDKTFVNVGNAYPGSNASCTGAGVPAPCCTGPTTGTCVGTFPPPPSVAGQPSASVFPVTTAYRKAQPTATLDPGWSNVVPIPYPAYAGLNTAGGALSATGEGWMWYPHEYVPNENIYSNSGTNGSTCWGRGDFGPFMSPPLTAINMNLPSPTIVPEAYVDTMVVNGAPFPTITIPPQAVRFQILSVPNERVVNLQWYFASDRYGNICRADTAGVIHATVSSTDTNAPLPGAVVPTSACTEVKMVPTINPPVAPCAAGVNLGGAFMAIAAPYDTTGNMTCTAAGVPLACCTGPQAGACTPPLPTDLAFFKTVGPPLNGTGLPGISLAGAGTPCMPNTWPTDGREGGIPDPAGVGPAWVQIGTEGGFLPYPAVIPAQPINFTYNRRDVTLLDTTGHSLTLAPAERVDVIVDFGAVPKGSVLIMYNDNPAPTPTVDPRNDLYTDAIDYTGTDTLPDLGNGQGGAPPTAPGWGPNTRTIMQVVVDPAGTNPTTTWSATNLADSTHGLYSALPQVFGMSQPKPVVGHVVYNQPFTTPANHTPYPGNVHVSNPDEIINTTGAYSQFDHVQMLIGGSGFAKGTVPPPAGAVDPLVYMMPAGGGCITPTQCTGVGNPAPCCTGAGTGNCTDLSVMNATQTNYTIGYNGIGGVTLTTNGAGCTSPPLVTIGAPAAGGTTATAVATVSGGIVTGVTVTSFGSNYTAATAPLVTFTNPAGGGCTTLPAAVSTTAPQTIGTIGFTNPANGTNLYCLSQPYLYILGGGGTAASGAVMLKGATVLESIGITEGFDPEYGRMDVIMGTAPTPLLPTAPAAVATLVPGYHDPPTDVWKPGVPKAWRLTHLGVDSHGVHFHLGNFQLVNRVDYTNTYLPPDLNEFGWKEVFRTMPFTDMILASDINLMWLPFQIPRSNRLLDPTQPANASLSAPAGLPGGVVTAGVNNTATDYGWEYVFHCHYLDHEENDMMRPMVFDVTPPLAPVLSAAMTPASTVSLSWTASAGATGYTLQRATNTAFTAGLVAVNLVGAGTTYTDTGVAPRTQYYYRCQASNAAGSSAWSNTVSVVTIVAPTLAVPTTARAGNFDQVTLTWTQPQGAITSFTVQRATSPTFAAPMNYAVNAKTWTQGRLPRHTTYYYRVVANGSAGGGRTLSSAPSNVRTVVTP